MVMSYIMAHVWGGGRRVRCLTGIIIKSLKSVDELSHLTRHDRQRFILASLPLFTSKAQGGVQRSREDEAEVLLASRESRAEAVTADG